MQPPRDARPDDATLEIGVDQHFDGPGAAFGYAGRLVDVTEGRAREERETRTGVVFPVGGGSAQLKVRAGRYVVEAVSPSGDVIDADVEVGPNEIKAVRLAGEPSPHEWLGWQTVSGNLDRFSPGFAAPPVQARRFLWRWLALAGLAAAIVAIAGAALLMRAAPKADRVIVSNTVAVALPPATATADAAAKDFDDLLEQSKLKAARVGRQIFRSSKKAEIEVSLPPASGSEKTVLPAGQSPSPTPPPAPPPPTIAMAASSSSWLPWLVALVVAALAGGGGLFTLGRRPSARVIVASGPHVRVRSEGRKAVRIRLGAESAMATAAAAPPTPVASRLNVLLVHTERGPAEWQAVIGAFARAADFLGVAGGPKAPTEELTPRVADATWRTFLVPGAEPLGGPAAWCLDLSDGERGGLVKLALPWVQPDNGMPADVEILAAADPASAGRISAAVRDPRYATLLGYLAGGRISEAQVILEDAKDALFRKMANPYAAAAGGYVLLAGATTFEDVGAEWRQWLANLDHLYPWLPDGAVLEGINLLQTHSPDAREKLLQAHGRGIPVLTEGLRRLRDGLTYVLEDDADGRVAAALRQVSEVASRCDPQQIFTSLRLGR